MKRRKEDSRTSTYVARSSVKVRSVRVKSRLWMCLTTYWLRARQKGALESTIGHTQSGILDAASGIARSRPAERNYVSLTNCGRVQYDCRLISRHQAHVHPVRDLQSSMQLRRPKVSRGDTVCASHTRERRRGRPRSLPAGRERQSDQKMGPTNQWRPVNCTRMTFRV